MKNNMMFKKISTLVATCLILVLLTSCDDILSVNDPGAIQSDQLNDPALEQLIINGVYSEFQFAFNYMTLSASILSDEVYTDHTNIDHREFALFEIRPSNALNSATYTNLQKARVAAEDAVVRFQSFDNPNPINIAEAYAYAGYANLMLGLHFCSVPINGGPAQPWQEIIERAVTHFNSAITAATGGSEAAIRIANMARVGLGRAHLQLGNDQQAISAVQNVPADFEFLVYRSSNSSRETNLNAAQWISSDPWLGVDPRFQNLNDPRLRHIEQPKFGLNSNPVYVPFKPRAYEGWTADEAQPIDLNTGYILASGLEARYIIAEASGANAQTLNLVNERRAVGNQDAVNLSGGELMAELREQKARDFFLTVHRLADLRRYLDRYGVDMFPTGNYPFGNSAYGSARCFIIPQSELSGNPNL